MQGLVTIRIQFRQRASDVTMWSRGIWILGRECCAHT